MKRAAKFLLQRIPPQTCSAILRIQASVGESEMAPDLT
jgi:hypothetical protein